MTPAAGDALNEAVKRAELKSHREARELLAEHGAAYADESGIHRAVQASWNQVQGGSLPAREERPRKWSRCSKNFAQLIVENIPTDLGDRRVRVMALDEARLGSIGWHRRRYRHRGERPRGWWGAGMSGRGSTQRSSQIPGVTSVGTSQPWMGSAARCLCSAWGSASVVG